MTCYSIEPITRKYVKGYRCLSFGRNLFQKYGKKILDTAIKTGLIALKAPEETGKFIGNKIADKIIKSKPMPDVT